MCGYQKYAIKLEMQRDEQYNVLYHYFSKRYTSCIHERTRNKGFLLLLLLFLIGVICVVYHI